MEAGVCILIVAILAGFAYPSMVREADSRSHRLFKIQMRSWALAARTRAIETRATVALNYDKNARALQTIEEDSQGASKPLPDLKLPDDLQAEKFAADSNESPPDGWRVPFFSDGSTTGGGIQFQVGETTYSLIIDKATGAATTVDGRLPDLSYETWPAGGVQKRGS